MMRFDHAIIAVFDLDLAAADFEGLGFTIVYGGEHDGGLTHNALITFANGTYIELLAPTDPGLLRNPPEPGPGNYLFLFEAGEGFAGYALHTNGLDAVVDRVRERGIEIADPSAGGRQRVDGEELAWRSAFPLGSVSPFFMTDETPRELRVRSEPEIISHLNGAQGIVRVLSVVSNLEKAVARYASLLGENPIQGTAIQGAETAAFNIGTLAAIIAAPTESGSALADYLEVRGEGLYQIEIATSRPPDSNRIVSHGARIALVAKSGTRRNDLGAQC